MGWRYQHTWIADYVGEERIQEHLDDRTNAGWELVNAQIEVTNGDAYRQQVRHHFYWKKIW
jgi:hypothetical protein